MKSASVYSTVIVFAVASLLSSCAFLQKGEFAQRRYYEFPRTKHTVEEKNETVSVKTQPKPAEEIITAKEEKKVAEPIVSASASKKEIIISKPVINVSRAVKHKTLNVAAEESTAAESPAIDFKKSDILKRARKSNYFHSSDDALMLFLEIIASIFVPPLGVFLKDHHTNKWFWTTLILCIAGLVLFYSIFNFGWLLYVIAIIIALLDVFDAL